jgi:hypothetical protein
MGYSFSEGIRVMSISVLLFVLFAGSAIAVLALCWNAPRLNDPHDVDTHRLNLAEQLPGREGIERREEPPKDKRLSSIPYTT